MWENTRGRRVGGGRELLEGEEGGGGSGTQKFVYQKWPDQIFPMVNFVVSHDGHFGLGPGGGDPPIVYGGSTTSLWGGGGWFGVLATRCP